MLLHCDSSDSSEAAWILSERSTNLEYRFLWSTSISAGTIFPALFHGTVPNEVELLILKVIVLCGPSHLYFSKVQSSLTSFSDPDYSILYH